MNARKKSRSLSLLINAERVQTRKKGPGISVMAYTKPTPMVVKKLMKGQLGGQMERSKGHKMPARLTIFSSIITES